MKRPYDILKLKGGKITETTKTEMTGNEKAKLLPTDTGIVVNDFLMEYFPESWTLTLQRMWRKSSMKWRKEKRNGLA